MEEKVRKVKVALVVEYRGHSLSANGSVNFSVKAGYSELVKVIQVMQMLNEDITAKAKIPGAKPMALGMFRLKQIAVDGDGEATIKFNGLNDFIEMDNLNLLPTTNNEENREFVIQLVAEIAEEADEEDGEEDE